MYNATFKPNKACFGDTQYLNNINCLGVFISGFDKNFDLKEKVARLSEYYWNYKGFYSFPAKSDFNFKGSQRFSK